MNDRMYYWVMGTLCALMFAWIFADMHYRSKDEDACKAKHGVMIEGKGQDYCIREDAVIDIRETK